MAFVTCQQFRDSQSEQDKQIEELQNKLDNVQLTPGPKGDKGDTGPQGMTGLSGDSAYESWKKLGNQGTQQDFINSLKGRDGIDATDVFMTYGNRFDLTTLTAYGTGNDLKIEDEFLQKEETANNGNALKVNKGIDTHSISIIKLYSAGWQILNTKETGLFDLFTANGLDMKKFDTAIVKLFNPKVPDVDPGSSNYPILVELYLYSLNGRRSGKSDGSVKLTRQYRSNPLVRRGDRILKNKASFIETEWTEWSLETNVDVDEIPTVAENYTAGKGIILNGNNIEANLGNNIYFDQDNKISTDGDALEIRASTRMTRPFNTINDSEMEANDNLYKINTRLKVGFEYNKPVISYKEGMKVSSKNEVNNVKIRLSPAPSNDLAIKKIENAHPTHHEVTWVQEGNDWVFTVGTLYKNEPVFADLIVYVDGTSLMKVNGATIGTSKNVNYLLDIEYDATEVTTVAYKSGLRAQLTRNS